MKKMITKVVAVLSASILMLGGSALSANAAQPAVDNTKDSEKVVIYTDITAPSTFMVHCCFYCTTTYYEYCSVCGALLNTWTEDSTYEEWD